MRTARRFTYRRGSEVCEGIVSKWDRVYVPGDGRPLGYVERVPGARGDGAVGYRPVIWFRLPEPRYCERTFRHRASAARWLMRVWERHGVR